MCSEGEIVLEIENTPVTCKKDILVSNSDYFKAMLEGNFIEKSKNNIKLVDVDLKAMNIILATIWDESYIISDEDILLVLHTACMLQFVKIRDICLERITESLSPKTCIKIWHITEQLDIRPLFLQAKSMALEEFLEIKDSDSILELTLDEIFYYLGHINLKTDNELSVFQTAMRWWYENNGQYENTTNSLVKLLSCIDFQNLTTSCIREILIYPDIANNPEIVKILSCILLLKSERSILQFPDTIQQKAGQLCKSKCRMSSRFPCILVNIVYSEGKCKKFKVSEEQQQRVVYYDKFKRKRLYEVVDNARFQTDSLTVVYYDYITHQFRNFFDTEGKCLSLHGFKLVGYKEFIFLYGGEFLIGKGHWNNNFWVYDTIRERWERKCVLPFPRRHFETCMVGDILYIVGGTGVFRVIQENMFSYSYKENKWSEKMALPCSGRQLKCCSFLNQLFLLNVSTKCGYFLNENTDWLKMHITVDDTLISKETEFAIFSYKDKIYLKGRNLIEFKVVNERIVETSVKEISDLICDKIEVELCGNIVYTLYKYRCEDQDAICLEWYNLDTGDIGFVFKKDALSNGDVVDIDGGRYKIIPSLKMFSFQHCNLVEKNELVNESFT